MSKVTKFLSSKAGTTLLFVLAGILLLFSGIGGAKAALMYQSEIYSSEIQLFDIGVSLLENGEIVSYRDYDSSKADGTWKTATGELLVNMLPENEKLKLGVVYPEEIAARNTGTIDEYARIAMTTYWTDPEGQKVRSLSPSLVEFAYDESGAWLEDTDAKTAERRVFYYSKLLPQGETTEPLTSTVRIDDSLASKVTQTVTDNEDGTKTIKTVYDYDGVKFNVEAEVDAIQDHNPDAAAYSAWGMSSDRIAFNNGTVTVANE